MNFREIFKDKIINFAGGRRTYDHNISTAEDNQTISQAKFRRLLRPGVIFLLIFTIFVLKASFNVYFGSQEEMDSDIFIDRSVSDTSAFDLVFYNSLYNSWRDKTNDHVPPEVLDWLKLIWGPSPYKKETILIRDRYLDSISQINMSLAPNSNKILIGISSAAADFQRRQLVRAHQIAPFNNLTYAITWRFVLLSPNSLYKEALRFENNTHGDLIILESISDSRENSRSQKLYEFFRYVELNMSMYNYVAKLDTDCYLNVPDFWNNYFNHTVQELDFAIVALFIEKLGRMDWPMGAFEAITWKVMLLLNRLYENVEFTNWAEDLQLGWYLYDAEINYTKVAFPTEVAYDFRFGCNPSWISDVTYNALRVHELKAEIDYVNVANCFTSNGVNTSQIDQMRLTNWTS
jgi:hypothetical protein